MQGNALLRLLFLLLPEEQNLVLHLGVLRPDMQLLGNDSDQVTEHALLGLYILHEDAKELERRVRRLVLHIVAEEERGHLAAFRGWLQRRVKHF